MSSARVDNDIQIFEEGNNGGSQQHVEPEVIINPVANESRSGSEPGHNVNADLVLDHSGSESRQHHSSEQNQSATPEGGNVGQEQGDSSESRDHSQNVGGAGNNNLPPRMPTSGGAGDDRTGAASPADRQSQAKERATMMALELIKEAHDIMQISGSVRLAGQ
jgi:hypothetical protein